MTLGTHFNERRSKHLSGIMTEAELESLLGLKFGADVSDVISAVLLKPLGDLTVRPGKRIRGRLVELGYQLASNRTRPPFPDSGICRRLMEGIEFLHAGSLAVDDVQDGSKVRRGQPALHLKYGLPIALNSGNWLYFWPLEIINRLDLTAAQKLQIFTFYHRTLLRAHLGQAMDIGVPIDTVDQSRVPSICLSTMELKSGALFALALLSGAVVGNASNELLEAVDTFGHGFGIGLQMFDDIGNVEGIVDSPKCREDLILRRPTWIWACAAKYYSGDVYREFILAVHQLPSDHHPLDTWFDQHDFIKKTKSLARDHMKQCLAGFEEKLVALDIHSDVLRELREVGAEISRSYE